MTREAFDRMPELALIRIEISDAIATMTLDDPDRGNATGAEMLDELNIATRWLTDRDDLRALVITGEGSAFCAGGDMTGWWVERHSNEDPHRHGRWLTSRVVRLINEIVTTIRGMPFITVAAINGYAVGAGVGLALACDVRVAGTRASVLFGYSRLGASPDAGLTWCLPRIVGDAHAMTLLLEDKPVKAARLEHLGLVAKVFDAASLMEETERYVIRLVRRNPPYYVRAVKQLVTQSRSSSYAEQLHAERELLIGASVTPDSDAALEAFSNGDSLPEFRGWISAPVADGEAAR